MKTIAELSQDLITSLREGRQAIIGRGGTIANDAGFQDFRDAIYNIPADNAITTVTDNSIALVKTVPANSTKCAYLAEFGGMTYKCKQLIPYPFVFETYSSKGVTFTANADQTITITGTPTENASVKVVNAAIPAKAGETFYFATKGNWTGSNGYVVVSQVVDGTTIQSVSTSTTPKTFTVEQDCYFSVTVVVIAGNTYDDTITIMLSKGDTAEPWEPYFEGLRDAKVTEIVSNGKNLFDISQTLNANFVDNGDGTYTITKNTATKRFSDYCYLNIPAGSNIAVKGMRLDASSEAPVQMELWYADDSRAASCVINGVARYRTLEKDLTRVRLYIDSSAEIGDSVTISDVQIEYGTVATDYVPFRAPISYPIPAEIQAHEGYGKGVNDANYTYVDLKNGVFVPNVKEGDLGSYSWNNRQSNGRQIFGANIPNLQGQTSSTIPINALAADYRAVSVNATWVDRDMAYNEVGAGVQRIEIVDNRYTSSSAFKQGVSGKKLVYAVETATPISLSVDFSPLIEVEGGGSIEFVNEYGYAVPSKMIYQTLTQ